MTEWNRYPPEKQRAVFARACVVPSGSMQYAFASNPKSEFRFRNLIIGYNRKERWSIPMEDCAWLFQQDISRTMSDEKFEEAMTKRMTRGK
jgi:hypothetical protein